MTSGAVGANRWVLRFERRTAPYIEPLMGWTGGDEPLAEIELTFHSCEEAVRYAEREGLSYRVEGEALAATAEQRHHTIRQEKKVHLFATAAALAWRDPRYGLATLGRRPDFDRALINPASVYAAPSEVLHDPSLTTEDKREILRRWAWDAWLLEVAADEAMAGGEPSRFDEVKAALASLDRIERTTLVVAQNASWMRGKGFQRCVPPQRVLGRSSPRLGRPTGKRPKGRKQQPRLMKEVRDERA